MHSLAVIDIAKENVRLQEIGVQLYRSPQLGYSLIVLLRVGESCCQNCVSDEREWLKFDGTLPLRDALFSSSYCHQEIAVPVVGGRVVRVQLNCPLEFLLGS